MTRHAKGTFDVKTWDERAYDEMEGGPKLTRASVTQSHHGDIEGEGALCAYFQDESGAIIVTFTNPNGGGRTDGVPGNEIPIPQAYTTGFDDHLGANRLVLNVNKRNEKAIRAYRRNGFTIVESEKIDIGNGFVMDDYVMAKELASERER